MRLYAESRLSNPIEKDKDTLQVLIFLVTLPDMFFVATVFLLLGFFSFDWPWLRLSNFLFDIGVILLVLLHIVEWRRNFHRVKTLPNKHKAILKYFHICQ